MRDMCRKIKSPAAVKMSTKTTTPPLIPPISAGESPADATRTVLVYLDVVRAVDITMMLVLVTDGLICANVLANIRTLVDVIGEEARESVARNTVVDKDV